MPRQAWSLSEVIVLKQLLKENTAKSYAAFLPNKTKRQIYDKIRIEVAKKPSLTAQLFDIASLTVRLMQSLQ
ncbi:hypothetical protein SS50377_22717 [Spironucleus salmonicida]|uniref:Myb-like DNA-binding domain-containing protein n=1 Tax=Spironucleus salmonicida TaxID=348837 RepID=V6LTV2_9EUKA|nr:hypothetical protein SS50377_22717 [Spironucleus salmonicida]|eukprot:EST44194.1 Hypothetical protein SS50377_16000 [Spironucleus salmonicida]